VIARNRDATHRERQYGPPDTRPAFVGSDAENDDERVHEDALVPAESTGDEAETETEIEAPGGRDEGDDCRDREQSTRLECGMARHGVA
jgi:hypothetical protein